MAYIDLYGFGADPEQSSWTGEEAAHLAKARFDHAAMMALAANAALRRYTPKDAAEKARWTQAGNATYALIQRMVAWGSNQGDSASQKWFKALTQGVGIGFLKLIGQYKSEMDLQGHQILAQVKLWEEEVVTLCKEVKAITSDTFLTCVKLTEPVRPKEGKPPLSSLIGSVTDPLTKPAIGLATLAVIGAGIYFGGSIALRWLEGRNQIQKSQQPEYLRGKVS